MGEAVSELAARRGHEIVARFDEYIDRYPSPSDVRALIDEYIDKYIDQCPSSSDVRALIDEYIDKYIDQRPSLSDVRALRRADAVIDFTLPDAALENIEWYCRWGLPAVIGTTGWYDRLDEVQALVDKHDGSILYAPNFSIGVALLARAIRSILPLLDELPEYDVAVHESHHIGKADSPSGTALMLGDLIMDGLDRKHRIETETQHGRIDAHALHVTSSRLGGVVGRHDVALDSPFDKLEFSHEAKNRRGFAFGAVRAAEWLPGRKGLFTLDDLLAEWLGS